MKCMKTPLHSLNLRHLLPCGLALAISVCFVAAAADSPTLDTAATLQRLDEIFPGPGGSAPQAYAW